MSILKLALISSLRIVFMGSLKVALFVYATFLSDTPFAGAVPEGNDYVGDNTSYAAPEGDNGNIGQAGPNAARTPALTGGRKSGFWGDKKHDINA